MKNRYLTGLVLLLAWLLPILACNFPGLSPVQQVDPDHERIQTVVAEMLATAQASMPPPPQPTEPFSPPGLTPGPGLPTRMPTPDPAATPLPTPATPLPLPGVTHVPLPEYGSPYFLYTAHSGDTLPALAGRFEVSPEQISSAEPIPPEALLRPGQLLAIPNLLGELSFSTPLLPDSEVIYSPGAAGFDVNLYVRNAGGYLASYLENVGGSSLTGPEVVQRIALETSVNPLLLLAFLEYRSGWVFGQPATPEQVRNPIGFDVPGYQGLYKELSLTAKQINTAYYEWRSGSLTRIGFPDDSQLRLSPGLNAGSVALQYLFAQFYRPEQWASALYEAEGFMALYERMFGNAWLRAASIEPLLPAGLSQPQMELPFRAGERWSFTGGPHIAWTTGSPKGALDFAPITGEPACVVSQAWVTASAPGLVVRAAQNTVVVDLDGDGYEQTGWAILYLHVAQRDQVQLGTRVNTDDPLGHPSCEGGRTTGTHVHIARKYNGEWIEADGPLPFVLSGWEAQVGERLYEGALLKGDQVVQARPDGDHTSVIVR